MRISDWSSDVCSSDLIVRNPVGRREPAFENAIGEGRDAASFDGGDARIPAAVVADLESGVGEHEAGDPLGMAARKALDRKSVVWGKSVAVRVDLGGPRTLKKKKE